MFLLSIGLKKLIKTGRLTIIDHKGRAHEFAGAPGPHVTIRFTNAAVPWKIVFNRDLGLGEGYMDGTLIVEDSDIFGLMDLLAMNVQRNFTNKRSRAMLTLMRFFHWSTQYNPIRRSRANVAHHYDLSDELYDLFLDDDRQYSCAYFAYPEESLESAQHRKKIHLEAKLHLKPDLSVLDIGCGWGGLALHLAQASGANVTGITLSENQLATCKERAVKEGLTNRLDFALKDYRHLDKKFDRIVSVGMFEHVGASHYNEFFDTLYDTLTDDGIALVHTIGRTQGPLATNAWVAKYIFPGGYIPSMSEVIPAIEQSGLYMTDLEILRLHYADTLKEWRARFAANRDKIRDQYDERFCRMWEYYLVLSEVAFRHCGHVVFQIQLTKQQDAVPLTRDYITAHESQADSAIAAE